MSEEGSSFQRRVVTRYFSSLPPIERDTREYIKTPLFDHITKVALFLVDVSQRQIVLIPRTEYVDVGKTRKIKTVRYALPSGSETCKLFPNDPLKAASREMTYETQLSDDEVRLLPFAAYYLPGDEIQKTGFYYAPVSSDLLFTRNQVLRSEKATKRAAIFYPIDLLSKYPLPFEQNIALQDFCRDVLHYS